MGNPEAASGTVDDVLEWRLKQAPVGGGAPQGRVPGKFFTPEPHVLTLRLRRAGFCSEEIRFVFGALYDRIR